MELAKMNKLKLYSQNTLYAKIKRLVAALPAAFLTKNLLTKKILTEKIDRLTNCSTRNIVHKSSVHSVVNKETGEIYRAKHTSDKINLYLNNSCGQFLICPICSRKRSEVIKAKYTDRIKRDTEKYPFSYMVTFTIENKNSFVESFDLLQNSLRAFRRQGQKRGFGNSGGESAKIKSALICHEVKEGANSEKWHSHSHAIVFCDEKLDYSTYDAELKKEIIFEYERGLNRKPTKKELGPARKDVINFNGKSVALSKLSREWLKASGNTSVNIEVEPQKKELQKDGTNELIYYKKVFKNGKWHSEKKYTRHEIIKYASKLNELPESKLIELITNKDKRRFLSVWGDMRKADELEPETVSENEETLSSDYIDAVIYNHVKGEYRKNELTERDYKIVNQLVEKKELFSEYRANSNRVRAYYNRLINDMKTLVELHGLKNEKKNLEIIHDVNSIRKAYRIYIEYLFRHTVDIPTLRNRRLDKKFMSRKQKYYFNMIETTFNFIGGSKCKKRKSVTLIAV